MPDLSLDLLSALFMPAVLISVIGFVGSISVAQTLAAGAYTAVGLAIAALFLTPLIYFLPKATLAATIIVAVLSLVDFSILHKTWAIS